VAFDRFGYFAGYGSYSPPTDSAANHPAQKIALAGVQQFQAGAKVVVGLQQLRTTSFIIASNA